jgi:pimeloyl-ACP methyl ester carboxylesterase
LERLKEGELSFLRGGEGEPLVLLHGIPGSAYAWEAPGRQLADRYQVIIPDLLGFGRSAPPRRDYYMDAQAVAIRELLVELGLNRLYLGGHDFGDPVALTLMRLFPKLEIRGLVLSATNVFTDTHVPLPLRTARIPDLSPAFYKAMVGNRLGMRMMYLAATKDKSAVSWERFSQHLTPVSIDLTRRIFQRSLADLRANYRAIENMLPTIMSPTLVLWGANDPIFAASVGERVHRTIPGSRLKIYEDTGHFVPEERPSRVAQDILDFFESIGS